MDEWTERWLMSLILNGYSGRLANQFLKLIPDRQETGDMWETQNILIFGSDPSLRILIKWSAPNAPYS